MGNVPPSPSSAANDGASTPEPSMELPSTQTTATKSSSQPPPSYLVEVFGSFSDIAAPTLDSFLSASAFAQGESPHFIPSTIAAYSASSDSSELFHLAKQADLIEESSTGNEWALTDLGQSVARKLRGLSTFHTKFIAYIAQELSKLTNTPTSIPQTPHNLWILTKGVSLLVESTNGFSKSFIPNLNQLWNVLITNTSEGFPDFQREELASILAGFARLRVELPSLPSTDPAQLLKILFGGAWRDVAGLLYSVKVATGIIRPKMPVKYYPEGLFVSEAIIALGRGSDSSFAIDEALKLGFIKAKSSSTDRRDLLLTQSGNALVRAALEGTDGLDVETETKARLKQVAFEALEERLCTAPESPLANPNKRDQSAIYVSSLDHLQKWLLIDGLGLLLSSSDEEESHRAFANFMCTATWWTLVGPRFAPDYARALISLLPGERDRQEMALIARMDQIIVPTSAWASLRKQRGNVVESFCRLFDPRLSALLGPDYSTVAQVFEDLYQVYGIPHPPVLDFQSDESDESDAAGGDDSNDDAEGLAGDEVDTHRIAKQLLRDPMLGFSPSSSSNHGSFNHYADDSDYDDSDYDSDDYDVPSFVASSTRTAPLPSGVDETSYDTDLDSDYQSPEFESDSDLTSGPESEYGENDEDNEDEEDVSWSLPGRYARTYGFDPLHVSPTIHQAKKTRPDSRATPSKWPELPRSTNFDRNEPGASRWLAAVPSLVAYPEIEVSAILQDVAMDLVAQPQSIRVPSACRILVAASTPAGMVFMTDSKGLIDSHGKVLKSLPPIPRARHYSERGPEWILCEGQFSFPGQSEKSTGPPRFLVNAVTLEVEETGAENLPEVPRTKPSSIKRLSKTLGWEVLCDDPISDVLILKDIGTLWQPSKGGAYTWSPSRLSTLERGIPLLSFPRAKTVAFVDEFQRQQTSLRNEKKLVRYAGLGNLSKVGKLLELGVIPNAKALGAALSARYWQVAAALLDQMAAAPVLSGLHGVIVAALTGDDGLDVAGLSLDEQSELLAALAELGRRDALRACLKAGLSFKGERATTLPRALFHAVKARSSAMVRALLDLPVTVPQALEREPLLIAEATEAAVLSGNLDVLQLLLEGSAEMGEERYSCLTPALTTACELGGFAAFNLLLDTGTVFKYEELCACLVYAVSGNHKDIALYLLEKGRVSWACQPWLLGTALKAGLQASDLTIFHALLAASEGMPRTKQVVDAANVALKLGRVDLCGSLIAALPENINSRPLLPLTEPFYAATRSASGKVCKLLIDAGVPLDAILDNHLHVVDAATVAAVSSGAAATDDAWTPLKLILASPSLVGRPVQMEFAVKVALDRNHPVALQMLLDVGVPFNDFSPRFWNTALSAAVKRSRADVLKVLLSRVVSVEDVLGAPTNLFTEAVQSFQAKADLTLVLSMLLEFTAGCDRGLKLVKALFKAVERGLSPLVSLLIKHGALDEENILVSHPELLASAVGADGAGQPVILKMLLDASATLERSKALLLGMQRAVKYGAAAALRLLLKVGALTPGNLESNGSVLVTAVQNCAAAPGSSKYSNYVFQRGGGAALEISRDILEHVMHYPPFPALTEALEAAVGLARADLVDLLLSTKALYEGSLLRVPSLFSTAVKLNPLEGKPILENLLKHSVDKERSKALLTGLQTAVELGRSELVSLLLEQGAMTLDTYQECPDVLAKAVSLTKISDASDILDKLLKASEHLDASIAASNGLSVALRKERFDFVEPLVKAGANVNHRSSGRVTDLTPLALASASGNLVAVQAILDAGATVDAEMSLKTAPYLLDLSDDWQVAHVRKGEVAEPGSRNLSQGINRTKWTALMSAALHGHLPVIELLLERGADPYKLCEPDYCDPLMLAVTQGHVECVRRLLEATETPAVDTDEARALVNAACVSGQLEVFKLFLDEMRLERVNEQMLMRIWGLPSVYVGILRAIFERMEGLPDHLTYLLTHIVNRGSGAVLPVVKLLVEKGADVKSVDEYGWTLLHLCTFSMHTQSVCRRINEKWRWCVPRAAVQLFNYLVDEAKLDVDARAKDGTTPLMVWAESVPQTDGYVDNPSFSSLAVLEVLLDHGADVDVQRDDGDTALHALCRWKTWDGAPTNIGHAVRSGRIAAWHLMEHGASTFVQNNNGETPQSLARGSWLNSVNDRWVHWQYTRVED